MRQSGSKRTTARPRDLAMDHVRDILRDYDRASDPNQKEYV